MAEQKKYVDPGWPHVADEHDHPVTELVASRAGALSPFGEDTVFPVEADTLPYAHPVTVVNR